MGWVTAWKLRSLQAARLSLTAPACWCQSPQQQRAYSLLPIHVLGGKCNSESLLLSILVSPGGPSSQGVGYQRWLPSPSMLLRSSRCCVVGAGGGPAEICTTFCTNMSGANTLCQRAYGVSEKDRQGMRGEKGPRGGNSPALQKSFMENTGLLISGWVTPPLAQAVSVRVLQAIRVLSWWNRP